MRKIFAILLAGFTAAAAVDAAAAQVRIQAPNVMVPKAPSQPRIQPVVPKVVVIPPSVVLQNVMKMNPGAQALGVKLRNQTYVVRLKQGGTIKQLGVDSVTGAVTPLP